MTKDNLYLEEIPTVITKAMFTRDWFQTDPNGSGPKIGPGRPSVYLGPFWNRSEQIKNWTCCFAGPVLDPFCTGSKGFHVTPGSLPKGSM